MITGLILAAGQRLMEIPRNVLRASSGKRLTGHRFQGTEGRRPDSHSDGIYAGVGELLNFGWLWRDIADYACNRFLYPPCVQPPPSAGHAMNCCQFRPGDDTTVRPACASSTATGIDDDSAL